MKQNPIDELVQAIASVNAEREQLRELIRDYWQLLELWDSGSVETDREYHQLHDSARKRTRELLGE